MRHDFRQPQPTNKQTMLKTTINLYHREPQQKQNTATFSNSNNMLNNLYKNKNCHYTHTPNPNQNPNSNYNYNNITNNINSNHNAHPPNINNYYNFSKLQGDYQKLRCSLLKQQQIFIQSCDKIKCRFSGYYQQLFKKLRQNKQIFEKQMDGFKKQIVTKFRIHFDKLRRKQVEIKNGNIGKNLEQNRNQFQQLAILEVPVFRIQFNSNLMQQFCKIIERIRPILTTQSLERSQYINQSPKQQKQNIPNNAESQSLLKKSQQKISSSSQQQNTIKKQAHTNQANRNICQFTCQQQLEWNPNDINSKRYDKKQKQIASEVIIQQPSSCQDSLMIADVNDVL